VQVPVGQSHPAATTDLAGRRRSASATALVDHFGEALGFPKPSQLSSAQAVAAAVRG
jgi:hypothetical protein